MAQVNVEFGVLCNLVKFLSENDAKFFKRVVFCKLNHTFKCGQKQ